MHVVMGHFLYVVRRTCPSEIDSEQKSIFVGKYFELFEQA